MKLSPLPGADKELVQIVDAALADAVQRSGQWLPCRLGCTQCCIGVFAINQLDAARLRKGMSELERNDPSQAKRLKTRVRESLARLNATFPGDLTTGRLDESEASQDLFESYGNDEVCPVLDPNTGACDLYSHRPITCRVFGPPVRAEDGLGICELCFVGASNEEIATCEMRPDPDHLEEQLVREVEESTGKVGNTIIAMSLR
jgi:Fe-S-cluster containining protein